MHADDLVKSRSCGNGGGDGGGSVGNTTNSINTTTTNSNNSASNRHSMLASDLEEVGTRWGYTHVELEVRFTIDLYPFFPPQVRVVRPRFQGFMLGQIAQMDCLQLSKWNSISTMEEVLASKG
jgi:hypothetical protein